MTTLTPSHRAAHGLKVDALVLGTRPHGEGAVLADGHGLPGSAAKHIAAALATLGARGKVDEVVTVTGVPRVTAPRVVLTGLGPAAPEGSRPESPGVTNPGGVPADGDALRRAAGAALRSLSSCASVAVRLPHEDAAGLGAIAEGAYAGTYAFTAHKSSGSGTASPARTPRRARREPVVGSGAPAIDVTVVSDGLDRGSAAATLRRAAALGAATTYARDLVNTAPNVLYPESFAADVTARVASSKAKVDVEVIDDAALMEGGFGGIVGVGQGSSRPPRIVVLTYTPKAKKAPSLALVGKGITFDTGGVCIKPPSGMLTMKSDMAGAAAVAATVLAAADLSLPVKVTGYLCLAENMPGGNAQRPGDVVTMRNGRTVEIIDTDAEGRMVLADGMALASESTPDAIVDVATLTGACVVALGNRVAGVMAHDEVFRTRVTDAARTSGELAWPLPLPADLRSMLDSAVADISHKGERWGGTLTAGLFLGEFVGQTADGQSIPWAHLDIAGPAFNNDAAWGHVPKGGTGYGVATLLRLIESLGS